MYKRQLKADGIPVSLDSYQPATQAYALSRGVAYLNDIRGFPDAAFYPQLAKSSAKLVVMHSVQDGQADRREAPAGDIMDHIAAFFDARIAALTGAGIKRNRLVLDPGMGFFLGAAPETSLSVLARFDELRLRFDLPVLLSVSRKSFLRALTGRGPGDVGAATLALSLIHILIASVTPILALLIASWLWLEPQIIEQQGGIWMVFKLK